MSLLPLPDHLSPSQINTFLTCRLRWFYRYRMGLKSAPQASMEFGTATHKTVELSLKLKRDTGKGLKIKEAKELFESNFKARVDESQREAGLEMAWGEDTPEKAVDDGVKLIEEYKKNKTDGEAAITPEEIEKPFAVEGARGLRIEGRIDLIEPDAVTDFKTSSKKNGIDTYKNGRQLAAYNLVAKRPQGRIRLLVRKQKPELVTYNIAVTERQGQEFVKTAHYVKAEMEHIFPNTEGWHCSQRWCGFWGVCEKEGIVR